MTMQDKRSALVSWLEALLKGFDTTYKVSDRFRVATFNASDNLDRARVMGDPARYAEVAYRGDSSSAVSDSYGGAQLVAHRFVVSVWHQLRDSDVYAQSSQYEFDNIIEGDAGLFPKLRDMGTIDVNGYASQVQVVGSPRATENFLDKSGEILSHFAQVTIDMY